jgi:hypothetical protein
MNTDLTFQYPHQSISEEAITIGNDVILLANSFNEFLDMLYDDES